MSPQPDPLTMLLLDLVVLLLYAVVFGVLAALATAPLLRRESIRRFLCWVGNHSPQSVSRRSLATAHISAAILYVFLGAVVVTASLLMIGIGLRPFDPPTTILLLATCCSTLLYILVIPWVAFEYAPAHGWDWNNGAYSRTEWWDWLLYQGGQTLIASSVFWALLLSAPR